MVGQRAEIPWPRGRTERVKTRVGEVLKEATAAHEEMGKQVHATVALREVASRQVLVIAVPVVEIPAIAVEEAERATRVPTVEVETA